MLNAETKLECLTQTDLTSVIDKDLQSAHVAITLPDKETLQWHTTGVDTHFRMATLIFYTA